MEKQMKIPPELERFSWNTHSLLEGKVTIRLPDFLNEIAKEDASQFLIMTQDINCVLTNENRDFIFLFSYAPQVELCNNSVTDMLDSQRTTLSRMAPGYIGFGHGTKEISKAVVGCMNYKSNAVNRDLYNILFLFPVNGKMAYGSFICTYEFQKIWTPIAIMALDSLQICE